MVNATESDKLVCPFCKGSDVTTKSKVVTSSTYWRCVACGQIWNPARLMPEWKWGRQTR